MRKLKIQLNDKQNLYFGSDFHYGHAGIVKGTSSWSDTSRCRPFDTLEEHDRVLVENINETVGENDILIFTGDWSFGSYKDGSNVSNIRKFREQLKCKTIHFVLGNHDDEIIKNKDNSQDLFASVNPVLELLVIEQSKAQGVKPLKQFIFLSHYAHRVWDKSHNGAWMLYGHCLDHNTEILTQRGWLTRNQLKITDKCYSFDVDNNITSYQPINEIFDYTYSGDMYSFKGRNIDFRGTSGHRHLLGIPYTNKFEYITSNKLKNQQRWLKVHGNSNNQGIELGDDLLRLYVWINADGSFENSSLVRFNLIKKRKINHLTQLLNTLGIEYSNNPTKEGGVKINFTLPEILSGYDFKPLDGRMKTMSPNQVKIFFDEYSITDGFKTSKNSLQIYSCLESEIDLIQNICVENGMSCNKTTQHTDKYKGWIASINFKREFVYYNFKNQVSVDEVIDEKVWCINTQFSNFLIRRNGKTHFTGNSHGSLDEMTPLIANPTWIGDQYFAKNYRTMDIGIDTHPLFKPYSYQEIKEIMEKRAVELEVDHHGNEMH